MRRYVMIHVTTIKANHYVVETNHYKVFQSYGEVVAVIDKLDKMGEVLYYTPKKYSRTTSKYFDFFKQHFHHGCIFEVCDENKLKEMTNGI